MDKISRVTSIKLCSKLNELNKDVDKIYAAKDQVLGLSKSGKVVMFNHFKAYLHPRQVNRFQCAYNGLPCKNSFFPTKITVGHAASRLSNLSGEQFNFLTLEKTYYNYNKINDKESFSAADPKSTSEYIKNKSVDFAGHGKGQKQQDGLYQGRYIKGLSHFKDILTAYDTIVRSDDGKLSPVNRLSVNGVEAGFRRDYPKHESLGQHFNILYKERPSVNVVLATDEDITEYRLPRYFEQEGDYQYGDETYRVKILAEKILAVGKLHGKVTTIAIDKNKGQEPPLTLSTLHIKDWRDFGSVDNADMAAITAEIANLRQISGRPEHCTMMHCRAGVGRTGVMAAYQMLSNPDNHFCLDEIVIGLRLTGNNLMVQNDEQYHSLRKAAESFNKPITFADKQQDNKKDNRPADERWQTPLPLVVPKSDYAKILQQRLKNS